MSHLRFATSYRSVIKYAKIAGIPLQPEKGATLSRMDKYLDLLVFVFLVWKIACTAINVFNMDFEDVMISGCCASLTLTAISLTVIYAVGMSRIQQLVSNADELSSNVLQNGMGQKEDFVRLYKMNSKTLCFLNNMFWFMTLSCPLFFCLSVPVMSYFEGNYGLAYPVPDGCHAEIEKPGLYEAFIVTQLLGLQLPALQKIGNEFVMFGLMKTQTTYYKYLAGCMQEIATQIESKVNVNIQKTINSWIKMHQYSIRNVQELYETFSPVTAVYYVNTIGIVACGVFYQINGERSNILQTSALTVYMSISIMQFFIFCNLADELAQEAEKLAIEAYSIPWYKLDKTMKSHVRLIINMANRPMVMRAYRSPAFSVDREAFLAFMVNLVSSYMGFSKIKDME